MSEIKFQEPPVPKKGPNTKSWAPVAEELRGRPGEWALVDQGRSHRQVAETIKRGTARAFRPPGSFEATARRASDGTYDVYARFVGDS